MWRIMLKYSYIITLLQSTLSCSCIKNNSNKNLKGEVGDRVEYQKRQIDFNDYYPTEWVVENIVNSDDAEINGLLFNETFPKYNKHFFHTRNMTKGRMKAKEKIYESDTIKLSTLSIAPKGVAKIQNVTNDFKAETGSYQSTLIEHSTKKIKMMTLPTPNNIFAQIPDVAKDDIFTKKEHSNTNSKEYATKNLVGVDSKEEDDSNADYNFDINYGSDDKTTTELNLVVESPGGCKHYKKTLPFVWNKMVDNWKIVYYTMSNRLKCFSINIGTLTKQEQRYYAKVYGDFNDTVLWNSCYLEITSNDNNKVGYHRKHFLQGSEVEKGVLENIIIDEERSPNLTTITLQHENPNQWLVINNLLLMRDCNNGHLAVFTRVAAIPNIQEIESALKVFGETKHLKGARTCLS